MAPTFWRTFRRSQVSAALASASDYGVLFALVEIFHVWYVAAVACGALTGAVLNFFLNRHWAFQSTRRGMQTQALRYALISAGSLVLNTLGVWAVTEGFQISYAISVAIVSLAVGFFYNFPLQKYFVFHDQEPVTQ